MTIEYLDANNQKYSRVENVELRLFSSSEAKRYGLSKEGGIGGLIIFVIVLGGLGFYFWGRKKKGKKIFGKW